MSGSGGRRLAGLLLAAAVLTPATLASTDAATRPGAPATTPVAATQQVPSDAVDLQLASVSPSVPPRGTFELRFEPTDRVPPGAELQVRFHRLITGRSGLRERVARIADGADPGDVVRRPVRVPDTQLGNPLAGWTLSVPITDVDEGSPFEVVLPTDGIIPVSIDLLGPDGAELWSRTVFLVRPPEDRPVGRDGRPAELAVTVALALDAPPTITLDGRARIDDEILERTDLVTDLLVAVPDFPFTLALEPNLLSGLDRSGTRTAEALASALQQPGLRGVSLRRPDVPVDTGGIIAANGLGVLEDVLVTGGEVLEADTLRPPLDHTWLLDDSLTRESLPALDGLGVRRVVLPAEEIERPDGVDEATARWRTMVLSGSEPTTTEDPPATPLTAIAEDPLLSLLTLQESLDPGVAANRVSTELAAVWFSAIDDDPSTFPGPQSFMFVPPQIDASVLLALAPALDGTGVLRADPSAEPPPAAPQRDEYATATVADRDPTDQGPAVAAFRESSALIGGVRAVVGLSDPAVETWTLLNSQSMSRAVDAAERASTHAAIETQSRELLARIVPSGNRTVVLGGEQSTIPLRFNNTLPYPVDVELRIRSTRLEFPAGDRQLLRLEPGENQVELDVAVRATGDSTVRFDLTSPGGAVGITSFETLVQATRFSGVGAALSILSLVVLAWWWISTTRKRRRQSARRDGNHPSASVTDEPAVGEGSVASRG